MRSAVEAMGAVATRSLLTSASVGVIGSVTSSTPLAAGPLGGLSGAVNERGQVDLTDRSLRALTAMILDGSEHVAGKVTSRKELQDKMATVMPGVGGLRGGT